ncbi:MAG: hypothetical protein QNL04_03305 [SAR324 cluster bacterium]|nr:hypothetical protein [SAR324 cluster bacterium]
MSESITEEEKILILEALAMMCAADGEFHKRELEFFTAVSNAAGINSNQVDLHSKEDVSEHLERICSNLNAPDAKKLLVLVLSAAARIDDDLEESEVELIKSFSSRLGLKPIDLDKFTHKELAKNTLMLTKKHS